MKKKLFSVYFIFSIVINVVFSQSFDLKYYSDYVKNYSGYAWSLYMGELFDSSDFDESELEDILMNQWFHQTENAREIKKLNKKNTWLLNNAMNEWDYQPGEYYFVVLFDSEDSETGLFIITHVTKKKNYEWSAVLVDEDSDVPLFENLWKLILPLKAEETFDDIEDYSSTSVTVIPSSEEYVSGVREIYEWYTSLGTIQTTTRDKQKATVRIDIALGYKKDDKGITQKLTEKSVEIKDLLRKYFSNRTAAELQNTNNEDKMKNELKDLLNTKIFSENLIRDVVFLQKDIIE